MSGAAADVVEANRRAWPQQYPLPSAVQPGIARFDLSGPWPALFLDNGGRWLTLHSQRDPVREAHEVLTAYDLERESTLFVVGLGLGYLLDALEQRDWPGRVVAFEPEPALVDPFLARRDWSNWFTKDRLTVLIGPTYEGVERLTASLDPAHVDPQLIINPVVGRVRRPACDTAVDVAQRAWFGARSNQQARRANAGRYLLNTLRNLPAIQRAANVTALMGAFPGLPAVVVAAGPSLDQNLADIGAFRDRVLLVAVDTALRPLLSAGIQPDLVVAVDPGEANARHLTDLPVCPDTYLVSEGSLDPEALRHFTSRQFLFRVANHHPWPWAAAAGVDVGRLRAWGSVLTTAFDLALVMGCDPIVFAGADLAFTGGRPYARGTTYEEDWRREQAWGQTLESAWATRLSEWPERREAGVDGAPALTAGHLRAFRDWIIGEARRATGRTIVNATGAGILVGEPVQQRSLAAIAADWTSVASPISARLARLHQRNHVVNRVLPKPAADVTSAWIEFANVALADIGEALDDRDSPRSSRVGVRQPTVAERGAAGVHGEGPALAPAEDSVRTGLQLSSADRAYLDTLSETLRLSMIELTDPGQDLSAALLAAVYDLTDGEAVVVVDRVGVNIGAQARHATHRLLCDRPDLWLDDRRFTDRASRLMVLRGNAAGHAAPADQADAMKWHPSHEAVADELAPIVMKLLAPRSVIDLGCGPGYWVQALKRLGVSRAVGVTPRLDGGIVPDLVRAPLVPVVGCGDDRFDLCLCFEVAECLPPEQHELLIAGCTRLSDTVAFSMRLVGTPGTSPHLRPLVYWAALFWKQGYVLDMSLRREIEHRWSLVRTACDCAVLFRRRFTPEEAAATSPARRASRDLALAIAEREDDLYLRNFWRATLAADPTPAEAPFSPCVPSGELVVWEIPRARMARASGAQRLFRFRTDAARWYVTHPGATLHLTEDGHLLPEVNLSLPLSERAPGGWSRWRDEVCFEACDGSDPRTNHHTYALALPVHVAAAEGWVAGSALAP